MLLNSWVAQANKKVIIIVVLIKRLNKKSYNHCLDLYYTLNLHVLHSDFGI
jgi:hypothetical protein